MMLQPAVDPIRKAPWTKSPRTRRIRQASPFSTGLNLPRIAALQAQGIGQFSQFITSVPILFSIQSDLGITLNGSTVSAWADQSGNGYNFTQSTPANQPTYATNVLNGYPCVTFDGVSDTMKNSAPNSGGAILWTWGVYRINSWVLNSIIFGGSVGLWMATTTPSIQQVIISGAHTVNPAAVGSWFRAESYFSSSASDYLHAGATTVGGTSTGSVGATTSQAIGSTITPSLWSAVSIVAHMMTIGKPTPTEISSLDAAITAKYGGGVAI